jgi:hypothetical protein
MYQLNLGGVFVTDEATYRFTHGTLLALTFTVWPLNASLAADGWSYFSFKCLFLHLSWTAFSFSSNRLNVMGQCFCVQPLMVLYVIDQEVIVCILTYREKTNCV